MSADREAMNALVARVWHWLLATGLPLCVGAAVFAGPLVTAAFGSGFENAVPLVQILCAAAAIALLANVLGTLLVAQGIVRPMVYQNIAVATFNVAGNIVLAPRYGVIASAWLTVATEAMVTLSALFLLRGRLQLGALLARSPRPALSVAGFAAVGLLLASWPAAALLGIGGGLPRPHLPVARLACRAAAPALAGGGIVMRIVPPMTALEHGGTWRTCSRPRPRSPRVRPRGRDRTSCPRRRPPLAAARAELHWLPLRQSLRLTADVLHLHLHDPTTCLPLRHSWLVGREAGRR